MADGANGFLQAVLRSGVMTEDELQDALGDVPIQFLSNPSEIAKHFIHRGKLSRFQAHKLLSGATRGLRLAHYLLQTPIGKGGMGAVYLALDERTGQHVAIKVLPPKRAQAEERYLTRFQREMALSQKLSHPHIAQTHEAGVSDGVYFIAMEYIPGQSLYQAVMTSGPLPVDRAAHLFDEAASALEHAHGLGLIHRDLKPSNIMVTPNDHAKLLDFGLAIMQGEVGGAIEVIGGRGYMVGSADYMAPEQSFDATHVDGRSDLYALGCVLYFALTGKTPFTGSTTKEKVSAHRYTEPNPIQWVNHDIPDDFARIVHKLLAKNPADRHQNAAQLRADLSPWCPKDAIRPVEKEGDQVQEEAARALASAPLDTQALKDAEPSALFKAKENGATLAASLGTGLFYVVAVLLALAMLLLV